MDYHTVDAAEIDDAMHYRRQHATDRAEYPVIALHFVRDHLICQYKQIYFSSLNKQRSGGQRVEGGELHNA